MTAAAPSPAAPSPAAPPPATAAQLRRARLRRLALRYLVLVGLPTLLAAVYVGALASPRYDAVAVVAVEGLDGRVDAEGGAASGDGLRRDAALLRERLRSPEVLAALEEAGLVQPWRDRAHDRWSRLDAGPGAAATLAYFREQVQVAGDARSNVLRLRARAFSAATATAVAAAVVEAGRAWVEELSAQAGRALVDPAERELAAARQRLDAARAAAPGGGDGGVGGGVGGAASATPSEPAALDHALALRAVEGALASLQAARLAAARAQRTLVVVSAPAASDTPARPRPLWDVATVLCCALALTLVLSLVVASVREHANL